MEHFHQKIPGFATFHYIYKEMVEMAEDGAHFVEVGSWLGKSASFMGVEIINSGKNIRFDVVDPFHRPPLKSGRPGFNVRNWDAHTKHNSNPEDMFACFQENIAPVADRINIVREFSVEAAKRYADHSLDFVWIDACHQYPEVKADIKAWRPKVKPGGWLGGDDHVKTFPGVIQAVEEAFKGAAELRKPPEGKVPAHWMIQL